MSDEKLMTDEEASNYLGFCKPSTLRRLRTKRRRDGVSGPKFIVVGYRTLRYAKSDLDAYAASLKERAE